MSFKKKDTFIKNEAEYESPDGDKYNCCIAKYGDRCFIEWEKIINTDDGKQIGTDKVTIDIEMFKQLYNWYCESFNLNINRQQIKLPSPDINDFRNIESSVRTSMDKYDDNVKPVESFTNWNSPETASSARTGVNIASLPKVEETPEDWKELAEERTKTQKGLYKAKGNSGKDFRRVNAEDLI